MQGTTVRVMKNRQDLCTALTDGPSREQGALVTTFVTDMNSLFGGGDLVPNISTWDVANVTNMSRMFYDA